MIFVGISPEPAKAQSAAVAVPSLDPSSTNINSDRIDEPRMKERICVIESPTLASSSKAGMIIEISGVIGQNVNGKALTYKCKSYRPSTLVGGLQCHLTSKQYTGVERIHTRQ